MAKSSVTPSDLDPSNVEVTTSQAPSQPGWIAFELPSGRKAARMAKPKGMHMKRASAAAGEDSSAIGFALAAQTCTIEGAPFTLEDILEMDLADAAKLVNEAGRPLAQKAGSSPKST